MNTEQTLQAALAAADAALAAADAALAAADAALAAARARLADIPSEIRALQDEEQRLTAMLSGAVSRNALGKAHDPTIDERSKLDSFRKRYGNAGFDIVRDIVARGGKIDPREAKRALGMAPDARGIWPRSNLISAVLRSMGCKEDRHGRWVAPSPKEPSPLAAGSVTEDAIARRRRYMDDV